MIITRKVLGQYLDLTDISNEQIADALNNSGFEVEQVFSFNNLNTDVVIGKILTIAPILETEKLSYCSVDINESEPVFVVCGANNIKIDRYIIFAKTGARLANGMFITNKTIKGKASSGMICSLTELGINSSVLSFEEQSGVYLFPENNKYQVGDPSPLKYLFEDDTAFHIDLTYNRSDALSAYEVARELSAYFNRVIKPLTQSKIYQEKKLSNNELTLTVNSDDKLVTALRSIIISLDTNLSSPLWLISRLRYINITPTNLIQDLLSYVTYETGQPLVGIDYEDEKQEIFIGKARANGKIGDYPINQGSLIISNQNDLIELLGIKFNDKYQVKKTTKQFIILSLTLDDKIMWLQQKQYKDKKQTSINLQRWSKPTNGHNLEKAIWRFLELLADINPISPIKALSPIFTNKTAKIATKTIIISVKKQQELLGIKDLTSTQIVNLLTPLGFTITKESDSVLVTVPNYRVDISNENDISEEIARRYGYNNIPSVPPVSIARLQKKDINAEIKKTITNYLLNQGIYETKTYNLVTNYALETFNFFNLKKPIKVLSHLSLEHQFLRNNLVSSLLKIVSYNNLRKINNLKIYEYEDIYDGLELHHQQLVTLLQGEWLSLPYLEQGINVDFVSVKGLLQGLLQKLNFKISDIKYISSKHSELHPYLQADVYFQDQHLGTIGKVHPIVQEQFNIEQSTFVLVLNVSQINNIFDKEIKYLPLTKNMFTYLDVSLLISKETSYETVVKLLENASERLVELVLKSEYINDEKLGINNKSWTMRLIFNDAYKQLNDDDLKKEYQNILQVLQNNSIGVR